MIILNEANRLKQFVSNKLGVELPKGGYKHPNNVNNSTAFFNDMDTSLTSYNLNRFHTPNDVKENPDFFQYCDSHNLPYRVADDNDKLHRLHRGINQPYSTRFRKDELMKTYGDKLTHKYEKQRGLFTDKERAEAQAARE